MQYFMVVAITLVAILFTYCLAAVKVVGPWDEMLVFRLGQYVLTANPGVHLRSLLATNARSYAD